MAGEIELCFELHSGLPNEGSLVARLQSKLDVGANDGHGQPILVFGTSEHARNTFVSQN